MLYIALEEERRKRRLSRLILNSNASYSERGVKVFMDAIDCALIVEIIISI